MNADCAFIILACYMWVTVYEHVPKFNLIWRHYGCVRHVACATVCFLWMCIACLCWSSGSLRIECMMCCNDRKVACYCGKTPTLKKGLHYALSDVTKRSHEVTETAHDSQAMYCLILHMGYGICVCRMCVRHSELGFDEPFSCKTRS